MTLWCVQIAGALCDNVGGNGVMWQILFSDDCYSISHPACSSIAFPHPQYQIELNLHHLPFTSLNMGRPVTNIKGWEWHSAFCDRSQKGNVASALWGQTSPFGVLSHAGRSSGCHVMRKSGLLEEATCRYFSWQFQMRSQPTDIWHHHRHQSLDMWVSGTASKWFQSSVIKSFLHLSLPSWGPRHHVERWLSLLCPEFLTQPMVVLCY